MRKNLLIIFLYFSFNAIAQKPSPIELEVAAIEDFSVNTVGGIKKGYTTIGLEEIALNISSENLGWWKGTNLFIHAHNAHGVGPSERLTGDLQIASNIEAGNYIALYEFYIKHTFKRFMFIVGQHDLNSEFICIETARSFLNSSFGIPIGISANMEVPIYPTTTLGVSCSFDVNKNVTFRAGIYDGDPGDTHTNPHGLSWSINATQGYLSIAEAELKNTGFCLKAGLLYHNTNFTNYSDTSSGLKANWGIYTLGEYKLTNANQESVNCFLQLTWAPAKTNQINYYIGGGFTWGGFWSKRQNDLIGIGFARAELSNYYRRLNNAYLNSETSIEAFYYFAVSDKLSFMPDLQYILNPGANSEIDNALLFSLRFKLAY